MKKLSREANAEFRKERPDTIFMNDLQNDECGYERPMIRARMLRYHRTLRRREIGLIILLTIGGVAFLFEFYVLCRFLAGWMS